jgi:hypothetical protein
MIASVEWVSNNRFMKKNHEINYMPCNQCYKSVIY